jgi:hypothetical protein
MARDASVARFRFLAAVTFAAIMPTWTRVVMIRAHGWDDCSDLFATASPPRRGHDAPHLAACRRAANVAAALDSEGGHLGQLLGEAWSEVNEPGGHADGQRNRGEDRRTLSGVGESGHGLCSLVWLSAVTHRMRR